jgi:molybdenum cofactor cytidylyltransferase
VKQTISSLNDPANVAAIVLAAGPSRRMGRPKQLLEFRGEILLKRAVLSALEAGCRPVVVVTGAYAAASRRVLGELDVMEAKNEQWKLGIGSSVRVGVEAVIAAAPGVDGIVLMLCDQPFVTREIIAGLIKARRKTSRAIIASSYAESYGVPALFSREHFGELIALRGDVGAKHLIQKHLTKVQLVCFPEGEIDIDTPEDLERFN